MYTKAGLLALRSRYPLLPRFQAKHNNFCGDLRTRRFDSDATNGERRRAVEQCNGPSFQGTRHHLPPGRRQRLPKDCAEPEGCRCFFFAAFGVSLTAQRPVQGKEGVVGCILPRFSAHRSRRCLFPLEVRQYSGWAQEVNTGLTEHSQKVPHITVWKHNTKFTFRESRRGLFNDDGVHSSTQGQYLLYKSIRGAVIAAKPFPVVSRTHQALTVAISSGCMYVWSLDITK